MNRVFKIMVWACGFIIFSLPTIALIEGIWDVYVTEYAAIQAIFYMVGAGFGYWVRNTT